MRWPPWPFSSSSSSGASESSPSKDSTSSSWWPFSPSDPPKDSPSFPPTSWPSPSPPHDLSYWFTGPNLFGLTVITTSLLLTRKLYTLYLRRYALATSLPPTAYKPSKPHTLFGTVTSVGDGDGFRLFHTPGGKLAGWGWLPWRKIPLDRKGIRAHGTISVRLAGIDAPERSHFGKPKQEGADEALAWLKKRLDGRKVRCWVYKKDQYDRLVASVRCAGFGGGWWARDVGLMMLNRGLATVYEAKSGGVFGGREMEIRYRRAEGWARAWRRGIWRGSMGDGWESPRAFKERTAAAGKGGKEGKEEHGGKS